MLKLAQQRNSSWKDLPTIEVDTPNWLMAAMSNNKKRLLQILENANGVYDIEQMNVDYMDLTTLTMADLWKKWHEVWDQFIYKISLRECSHPSLETGGMKLYVEALVNTYLVECKTLKEDLEGAVQKYRLFTRFLTLLNYVFDCCVPIKRQPGQNDLLSSMMKKMEAFMESHTKKPVASRKRKADE